MTNGIAGLLAVLPPINAPSGEARLDEETGQVSFASLFAGAAQAFAQQPVRLVGKPEGTSELDAENVEDADDTSDVGDTDKHEDPRRADGSDTTPVVLPRDPSPSGIDRSIAALDPALQERLGRVMARMREETGHEVQVGETYRSQSRQNALYAQGRSTPGPVVTWTQSSKHTKGRAVDLLVDGGSAGSDAYAALRRIASQEGLRTLGERDPGHLELPSNVPESVASQIENEMTLEGAIASAAVSKKPMASVITATVDASTNSANSASGTTGGEHTSPTIARVAEIAPTARVASPKVDRRRVCANRSPNACSPDVCADSSSSAITESADTRRSGL